MGVKSQRNGATKRAYLYFLNWSQNLRLGKKDWLLFVLELPLQAHGEVERTNWDGDQFSLYFTIYTYADICGKAV